VENPTLIETQPVDYPRISADDLAAAVKPLNDKQAKAVATHLDRWRAENPDALRVWTTKLGCVVQFWGMRLYYGLCKDCGGLVTDRRGISHSRDVVTNIGRWRERCPECADKAEQVHADSARSRMARLRRSRRESRDTQMVAAGMVPPRQGVAAGGKTALAQSLEDASKLRGDWGKPTASEIDEIAARYRERQNIE
jgi:hypothetical protein